MAKDSNRTALLRVTIAWLAIGYALLTVPQASAQSDDPTEDSAIDDPTAPDSAIRAAMNSVGQGRNSVITGITLRGLVAAKGRPPQVVIGIGEDLTSIYGGMEWRTSSGTQLRVAALDDQSTTIEAIVTGEKWRVDFGGPTQTDGSAPGTLSRVDLRQLPLQLACRLISDQVGQNIVASKGAADATVTIYLRNVDATAAIRAICDAYQFWFRRDESGGIVRVSTVDEYKRDLTDVQEEKTEVFTLNYPNVYDVGYAIRDLFGDRVDLRISEADDDVFLDLSDRLQRFDLIDSRTQGFGQGIGLGSGATFGSGGTFGSSGGTNLGNALSSQGIGRASTFDQFRTDTAAKEKDALRGTLSAEEIQRLEAAIQQLGGSPGSSDELAKELARRYVAPIHITVASRQNKLLVRTSDVAALEQIHMLVRELDVPTALVLLEIRVLSIDLSDGMESFFEYQLGSGSFQGSFATGNIAPPSSGLGPGGTGLRLEDLIFQYVDSSFGARLQVLETENRVQTLSTPILLTANNEVSRLFVGREVPLNRSFVGGQTLVNESTSTTATGTTNIEFRPVGTTLMVTPNINADRTVNLRIVQENSDVNSTAEVLVPSGTDFVPRSVGVVSSQSVSGTVVAKDDMAVAFGGLIERGTTSDVSGVPFLGEIPLLGVLFRRTVERETHREIVIVVKPYVIGTPTEYASTTTSMLRNLGVDLTELHKDPTTGEVLSPTGPFNTAFRFQIHGVDRFGSKRGGS